MPVLSANGDMVSYLVLQPFQSAIFDSGEFSALYNVIIAVKRNAQQSEVTWINFAPVWLPTCRETMENPGLIFIDSRTTHVMSQLIAECIGYSLYVIVDPSQTSMILQVTDLVVNRFLKTRFVKEYTASM